MSNAVCHSSVAQRPRDDTHPDTRVARIAREQHGVVSLRQLAACGLDGAAVRRRAGTGRLHRVHRGRLRGRARRADDAGVVRRGRPRLRRRCRPQPPLRSCVLGVSTLGRAPPAGHGHRRPAPGHGTARASLSPLGSSRSRAPRRDPRHLPRAHAAGSRGEPRRARAAPRRAPSPGRAARQRPPARRRAHPRPRPPRRRGAARPRRRRPRADAQRARGHRPRPARQRRYRAPADQRPAEARRAHRHPRLPLARAASSSRPTAPPTTRARSLARPTPSARRSSRPTAIACCASPGGRPSATRTRRSPASGRRCGARRPPWRSRPRRCG